MTTLTTQDRLSLLRFSFNDTEIRGFVRDQVVHFFVSDLGMALGYADGGRQFRKNITTRWAAEFVEGEVVTVKPSDFGGGVSHPLNNRGHLALSKDGIINAIQLSRTKVGRKLRLWVRKQVFPAVEKIARGEQITDEERIALGVGAGAVFGIAPEELREQLPEATPKTAREERLLLREKRLARAQELKAYELHSKALAEISSEVDITPEARATMIANLAETYLGGSYRMLIPETSGQWHSPTEMAYEFGVTVAKVGRALSALKLRGHRKHSKQVLSKNPHNNRTVAGWVYDDHTKQAVWAHLVERGDVNNVHDLSPKDGGAA